VFQSPRFGSKYGDSVGIFQSLESLWRFSDDGPVLVGPDLPEEETFGDRRPRFAQGQDFTGQRLS